MFAQEELAALQEVSKQKRPRAIEETTSTPAKRVNVESSQGDSERVLLSMAEWSHILQLRGDATETKNQSKVAYVNALKKHVHVQTLSLNLHDDLMYLLLKTKSGHILRALLDCGASISGVATRVLETPDIWPDFASTENAERKGERSIVYANSEKGESGRAFQKMALMIGESKTRVPTLYEMPLPRGVDILLGVDWFRKENPNVNWAKATIDLATGTTVGVAQQGNRPQRVYPRLK